jgi:hypothetical protein
MIRTISNDVLSNFDDVPYYFDDKSDCCGAGAYAGAASFSLLEPQQSCIHRNGFQNFEYTVQCTPGLWIRIRIQIGSGFSGFVNPDSLTLWIRIRIRIWIDLNCWIQIRICIRIRIESIRIHNLVVYCVKADKSVRAG